jgi:hypothetical protein
LLLVAVATLLPLAVPSSAGAAKAGDWVRLEFPCRDGKGVAVLGYSPTHPMWLDADDDSGEGVLNPDAWASWYKNPCKGQWLITNVWHGEPSEGSNTVYSIGTGMSGRMLGPWYASLADAPDCGDNTWDIELIAKPKQLRSACPE